VGGVVDDAGTPWERDTIVNVWSTTKTMTALSALVLADRGEIDVDAPVATYWPEFAAAGKEQVLVRHLMSHTAGLPGWEEPMAPEDLYDWEKATSLLAAQAPWWEPGTASGYHAVTQGYLVGEVVRRVTGQSVGTFFAKEVPALGADFHIGTPRARPPGGEVIPPPRPRLTRPRRASPCGRCRTPVSAEQSWDVDWRRAEIPAAGATATPGRWPCSRCWPAGGGAGRPPPSEAAAATRSSGSSATARPRARMPLRHGIGYGLPSEAVPISSSRAGCYWGGWGGSIVVVDLDERLVVSYVMNRMGDGTQGDVRGAGLVFAAYGALAAG
jgi:CubicO group peptidase (beta-lactamase class C family)